MMIWPSSEVPSTVVIPYIYDVCWIPDIYIYTPSLQWKNMYIVRTFVVSRSRNANRDCKCECLLAIFEAACA